MTGEVAPLGDGERTASGGELRASHQDRDRVVEVLRDAAGDGRLTAEELDERLEAALTARTYGELASLTADLPAGAGFTGPAAVGTPKELVRIESSSASVRRDGPWLVPQRMEVRVSSGRVTLDFTRALISQPLLLIDAELKSGSLLLITKPGIVVDTDEIAVRSGTVKVRAPWPETPAMLQIKVSGDVGSGSIEARPPRPPRRTFWQWLRRAPRPRALPPA
ncbi:MAG: DUF1707 domain-containing protein [Actinobacteria bacterium]|nr:DUF1707 domain-containing protein [Actinomycetota bacterium]